MSSVLEQAVLALRAHGHRQASVELAHRAIAWQQSQPQVSASQADPLFTGRALYLAERWDEAAEIFERLAAGNPQLTARPWQQARRLGWVGLCAARRGDAAHARAISVEIERALDQYTYGEPAYWRSRIAAVLGERQTAVDLLRDALARGLPFGLHLHHNSDYEALRDYPPFEELMRAGGESRSGRWSRPFSGIAA